MKGHRIRHSRRGVSLVELLVVMSAATVILTMSAGLIHRVMHAQSKARLLADVERTSLRLADSFRRDVHQATQATTDSARLGGDAFLRLQLADNSTIEYRRDGATIQRIQLAAGRTVSRDAFAFSEAGELEVKLENARLVVFSVTSRVDRAPAEAVGPERIANAVPVDLQIAAALGRDARPVVTAPSERGAP